MTESRGVKPFEERKILVTGGIQLCGVTYNSRYAGRGDISCMK